MIRTALGHLAIWSVLLLAACGPGTVTSNVLRFHSLSSTPGGASFAITPGEGQEGSLEFKSYAELVAQELIRQGYRQAAPGKAADLVVLMNYTVDNGRTEIWSVPIYGYTDNWRRFSGMQAGWTYPYYDQVGIDTHTTTLFTHRLELRIADGRVPAKGQAKPDNLFEGRAFAERTTRELAVTMPYLVWALFKDFPGENGVPVKVSAPERPRLTH